MYDTVVVGAGPAGLATSKELADREIDHVVLERGSGPGDAWSRLYDSMRLHTGKHLSGLPGLSLPSSAPLFVPASGFLEYLRAYARTFEVPVQTGSEVQSIRPGAPSTDTAPWTVETVEGPMEARTVVMATGILSNPRVPEIPGRDEFRGTLRHSVEYRRPDPYVGRRVLVVGAGNSAGEIAPELAEAGADVTVSVRSGANVVPLRILGIPVQYLAWALLKLPEGARDPVVSGLRSAIGWIRGAPPFPPAEGGPLDRVPLIGYGLVDAVETGAVTLRGGLERLTPEGARFRPPAEGLRVDPLPDGDEEPFDDVILATGYRPALGPVDGLVRRDAEGFAFRVDRVTSADRPGLFFVGHNYDATGGLSNIRRDAPLAAAAVERHLAAGSGHLVTGAAS